MRPFQFWRPEAWNRGVGAVSPRPRPWGPVLHPFQLPMPHHSLACGHVTLISASSVTRPCLSVYIQIPLSLSGSACTMPKLPIQGWNPSHGSDNTGSLTGCATRELQFLSSYKDTRHWIEGHPNPAYELIFT